MKFDKQHVSIALSLATLVILIVLLVRQDKKSENFMVGINNPTEISRIMGTDDNSGVSAVCKANNKEAKYDVSMSPSVDCVTRLSAYETTKYYLGNMFSNKSSMDNDNMMMKYCCGDKTIKPRYPLPANPVNVSIKLPTIPKKVSQTEIDALRF